MVKDFIPRSWAAFVVWITNFNEFLPMLAAKYGISAQVLAAVASDTEFVQYWVDAKESAKQQEKQLTDFMDGVTNGELGAPALSSPTWMLPKSAPATVPPGIKKRIREIAAGIKAQKSIYTTADGELLGIISPDEAGRGEGDYTPTIKVITMRDYHLGFEFRREGLDAVCFEVRQKGGDWKLLGDSAISPTDFLVAPLTPRSAEQVEIRAVFLKNYKPFGNWSPIYTATIAP